MNEQTNETNSTKESQKMNPNKKKTSQNIESYFVVSW